MNEVSTQKELLEKIAALENIQSQSKLTEGTLRKRIATLENNITRYSEAEELLQSVILGANVGFWVWHYQSEEHYVSNRWLEILGLRRSEITNSIADWSSRIHPDDCSNAQQAVDIAILNDTPYRVEFRMMHGNGSWVWIEGSGRVVEWDNETGTPVRLCGTHQDISERKATENVLHMFFEQPLNLHLIAQFDGTICRVNDGWNYLLGYTKNDLINTLFLDLIHPEDIATTTQEMAHLEQGISTLHFENRYQHKNGEYRLLAWSAIASVEDQLIYAVAHDITELEQTQKSLRRAQKMEAVGQMAGGIAHDFNNILGIILGNLSLLKGQVSCDEKTVNRLHTIEKSAQRATDLTKQLLGFARQQPAQIENTNINRTIEAMESLIIRSITPEVELVKRLSKSLWLTEVDAGDFEDALFNLILNARDAMPDGGRLIMESCNCTLDAKYCARNHGTKPGEYVQLIIKDNGKGIALAHQDLIFEPFYTTKSPGKGTGLGLAMTFGFIKRSKGYISVSSKLGMGTTFRIYLPRAEGEEQATPIHNPQLPVSRTGGNEMVLAVDDEQALLDLTKESLQSLGYRVLTAPDGKRALELLGEHPTISVLFSDIVMPGGINGYELAEQATAIRPNLKILLTSGYSEKTAIHRGQTLSRRNLLCKPYSLSELAQRLDLLLKQTEVESYEDGNQDRLPKDQPTNLHQWSNRFALGIEEIDRDHCNLLSLLRKCQLVEKGNQRDKELRAILTDLIEYTHTHFQREEAVMMVCNYPGLANHSQVHQLLIKQIDTKFEYLEQGKLNVRELYTFLSDWLIDHIQGMDHAIAPYCEGKGDLITRTLNQMAIPS